jgi:hypothetical protein
MFDSLALAQRIRPLRRREPPSTGVDLPNTAGMTSESEGRPLSGPYRAVRGRYMAWVEHVEIVGDGVDEPIQVLRNGGVVTFKAPRSDSVPAIDWGTGPCDPVSGMEVLAAQAPKYHRSTLAIRMGPRLPAK